VSEEANPVARSVGEHGTRNVHSPIWLTWPPGALGCSPLWTHKKGLCKAFYASWRPYDSGMLVLHAGLTAVVVAPHHQPVHRFKHI